MVYFRRPNEFLSKRLRSCLVYWFRGRTRDLFNFRTHWVKHTFWSSVTLVDCYVSRVMKLTLAHRIGRPISYVVNQLSMASRLIGAQPLLETKLNEYIVNMLYRNVFHRSWYQIHVLTLIDDAKWHRLYEPLSQSLAHRELPAIMNWSHCKLPISYMVKFSLAF